MGKQSYGKLNIFLKFTQLKTGTETQQYNPRDSCQPPHSLLLYFVKQNTHPRHVSVIWGTLGWSSA